MSTNIPTWIRYPGRSLEGHRTESGIPALSLSYIVAAATAINKLDAHFLEEGTDLPSP